MLIVVRHGRTEANASGLLLGRRVDPGLDDVGQRQAAALGKVLAAADRVIASPMRRTRETAAAIGRPVEIDERWIEIDYGSADGSPLADVPPATWQAWRTDLRFRLGDGAESLAEVAERVRAAVEDLVEEARTRTVVVVTHVSPIKAVTAWALGVPDDAIWRMYCAPASITEIATAEPTPTLRSFNVTAHVDGDPVIRAQVEGSG